MLISCCMSILVYWTEKSNKKHRKRFGGLGNKYYLCTRNSEMRLLTVK